MENYENAIEIMKERFSKDSLIAVATTDGENLYNRIVDAYYDDGAFYITTSAVSNKMKQIEKNEKVAICSSDWFTGQGVAKNLGWVLEPHNEEIRAKLREAFAIWYDKANNEQNKNCSILQICLTDGVIVKDHYAIRYKVDFQNKSAKVSENFGEYK